MRLSPSSVTTEPLATDNPEGCSAAKRWQVSVYSKLYQLRIFFLFEGEVGTFRFNL